MGNVRTLLVLIASVFFLSHCSGGNANPPQNQDKDGEGVEGVEGVVPEDVVVPEDAVVQMDLGGNGCIAGVYKGEGDIRQASWLWWFDQDLTVSIAFKGDSALVKVEGEDDDLLCTRYEGLTITKDENKEDVSVLNGSRVTNSRKEGSPDLVDGLLEIQVDMTDNTCSFNIPSYDVGERERDGDAVGSQLVRQEDQTADFDTLLEECGDESSFSELPSEDKEEE